MLGSFARASVFSFLAVWLALLVTLSRADGSNYLSHAFERLWLWERYQIAVAIEGAAQQKDILPFKTKKGQDAYNNKGSGKDSSLTYSEFMQRVDNRPLDGNVPKLTPPGDGRSIDDAAQELLANRKPGQLKPAVIDPSLDGKKFGPGDTGFDKKDPYKTAYSALFDRLEQTLTDYRIKGVQPTMIDSHMERIKGINDAIVQLRDEATQDYVGSLLKKPVANGGLGLGDDAVVTNEKPSSYPIGDKYEEVDFKTTFANNQAKLKDMGFKTRKDLKNWANNVGDPDVKAGPKPYQDTNYTHFRVLKTWKNSQSRARMTADELKTCTPK